MHKLLLGLGVALVAITAIASPAAAATFKCNEAVTGGTFDNVTVPDDGSCTLIDSTVSGNVYVKRNAYFQATNTDIVGKVRATRALTLFIDSESTVGRDVRTFKTTQVFIFNAEIARGLDVDGTSEVVNICGNLVSAGDINVTRSGTDILVGEPLADCGGNTVTGGDIEIERSFTDVEFVVRGNTVTAGDLEVTRNRGPVEKIVAENQGGDELECSYNEAPFSASGNVGWSERSGQCEVILTCNEELTGADVDEVVVPVGGACTLFDSQVSDDVSVLENAYFQATNTAIADKVRAHGAQTLFIDSQSSVGRTVKAHDAIQVFIFNATIGRGIIVDDATEVVQVCGTTVTKGDVEVSESGTDILIGSPSAVDCAGNTVSEGDMEIERNFTDVEFVVEGNSIPFGDLEVKRNKGPVEKSVQNNTGGGELECYANDLPFLASGNVFGRVTGQCIEV